MRIVCGDGTASFAFEEPEAILRADRIADVAAALDRADRALADGRFVAGYVGYEAGAAFVARQAPPPDASLPLVMLATYRARSPRVRASDARATNDFALGPLVPQTSRRRYAATIAEILRRIREGDVYQVNYAVPFTFAFAGDPYALFAALDRGSDYPYAAYVEHDAIALVSCSPELFVRVTPTSIATKPMKGTASDEHRALLANAKNRAEHVMIVDLLRNDLHRLSDDVRVERLGDVERYPTYATTTSTIVAQRPHAFALRETFAAMFPCGSVTGAPKVAAMQTIAALEGPRGAFCGTIGYSAPDGTGTWNVAIRTATIDRASGRGTIRIGGGIVADSRASDEWAEIIVKRRFIEGVAPACALVETLRRDPGGTYVRLDAHLARLARSADALHFGFDEAALRAHLDALAVPPSSVLVRIELDVRGRFSTTVRDLHETADAIVMWSAQRVDENDPLQGHKTTWRPQYAAAASEAERYGVFDALLCNRSGAVADGSRVNVFVACDDGTLLTPRVADGALPGILRAELIASGRARDVRLTREDVSGARALFIGNSARGLIPATLTTTDQRYATGSI